MTGLRAAVRARLVATWRLFLADPDPLLIMTVAIVIAVLGLLDVIDDVKVLVAGTLGVLAVISFTMFRQAVARRAEAASLAAVVSGLDTVRQEVAAASRATQQATLVVEVASGRPIRATLEEAVADTSVWHVRGGTGSFLRAWTLPQLAARARADAGSRLVVRVQILDPEDAGLCTRYAEHRKRLARTRTGSPGDWTPERVRRECLATILAAAWYAQHELLDVAIALRSDFSVIRLDVASSMAIATNEDPAYPALLVRRPSPAYRAFLADVEQSFSAHRVVPQVAVVLPDQFNDVDAGHVRDELAQAGHALPDTDAGLLAIRDLAFARSDPYP